MAFLLIIPAFVVPAMVWAAWSARPRRPEATGDSVERHRRALAALAPDQPADRPRRRRG